MFFNQCRLVKHHNHLSFGEAGVRPNKKNRLTKRHWFFTRK
jgi:hypothetical protein